MKCCKIGQRNINIKCERCGREVGRVGKVAYVKCHHHNKRVSYCEPCGKFIEHTPSLRIITDSKKTEYDIDWSYVNKMNQRIEQ